MAELEQETIVDTGELLALGLELQSPWRLVGQRVDTDKQPHAVFLEVAADWGAGVPLPEVWQVMRGSRLPRINLVSPQFFPASLLRNARMPRVDYPDHGIKQVKMP
ncbi:hypothetical protein DFAR_10022 [Desulfarculales bacterium]